jgi:nitroreductase
MKDKLFITRRNAMKKAVIVFCALFTQIALSSLSAQEASNPGLQVILNHYAASNFIAGSVNKADLDLIVRAGIRAPSSNNRQPWHFTVIQNQNLVKQIMPQAMDGNVLIVVSVAGTGWEILDGGLATESVYLAAQALGYGSRIYTGPTRDALNNRFKAELGLPSGYSAIGLVRIGKVALRADVVTGASSRKNADAVVNYK